MASIAVNSQNSAPSTCFLKDVASEFKYSNDPSAIRSDSIPVVDFSALTDSDPDRRSKAVHHLTKACLDWSFFILVNHGIPEDIMKATFTKMDEFLSLSVDEKKQYVPNKPSDLIKYIALNAKDSSKQTTLFWRENLKMFVHPELNCPPLFKDVVKEYSERTRKVGRVIVEAVTEGLGLDKDYVNRVLGLDSSFQVFAANYYPPCPQPDQAMGITPHTDPGLFTILIHNGVAGLQIQHQGQWFDVDSPTNSLLVFPADQFEVFTNGRCVSLKHKVVLNDARERTSIAIGYGPSKEKIIRPAAPFLEKDGCEKYRAVKYEECVNSQMTILRLRLNPA